MKALKWIIGIVVSLALIVTATLAYLMFAVDPNSYKPQLTELAQEQGISLNIEGELSWQLLPSLALSIGSTQISSARAEIPDVSFQQADLNLAWLPLLKRQLSVKAIHLEGADIRLGTAAQAANTAIAPLAAAPLNTKNAKPPPAFTLAIESLTISNSRLQLPPATAGASPPQLSAIDLQIKGLNLNGDAFKLKASFDYSDPALPGLIAVTLDTEASVEQSTQAFALSNTQLKLLPADQPAIELSIDSLSGGQQGAMQLDIVGLQVSSAGASLQASLSAQSVNDKITFESELEVPPMALRTVLSSWGIALPDTPDQRALQQASLKLSIKGSDDAFTISNLNVTLDDIILDGHVELALGPTRSVALQLHSNTIDLNRYITSTPEDSASNSSDTTKAASVEPTMIFAPLLAPLLWVGDGVATLDISLDGLKVDTIAAEKLQIKLQAANNIVQLKQFSADVFDGDIETTATINLQHKEPKINFSATISALSVGKALTAVNGEASLSGQLSAKFQGQTRGNQAEQLHQHLKASGEISLAKPYLSSFNIEKSYCDIAALIEKIPRKSDWPPGSRLKDLQASISLKGKKVFIERYTTGLGNISLSGKGLVDVGEESFDLLAISRLNGEHTSAQGCRVKSKRVRDKDVPIRCKDTFANAGGGSCKPDGDFVKQVLQDKIFDRIQNKSGLNEESEKALKGLLKGLFGN